MDSNLFLDLSPKDDAQSLWFFFHITSAKDHGKSSKLLSSRQTFSSGGVERCECETNVSLRAIKPVTTDASVLPNVELFRAYSDAGRSSRGGFLILRKSGADVTSFVGGEKGSFRHFSRFW